MQPEDDLVRQQNEVFGPPEPAPFWEQGWFQAIPQAAQQVGGVVAQGVRNLQQMQDPVGEDEARRRLIMERARQQYERTFGSPNPAGPSLAWQGNPEGVDYLLQRVRQARGR